MKKKKIPLGEIKGCLYENHKLVKRKINSREYEWVNIPAYFQKSLIGPISALVIYLLVGPLISLILNKKILYLINEPKFQKIINFNPSIIQPFLYDIHVENFIIGRIVYFIVGILIWLITPYLIGCVILEKYFPGSYDWKKLKESIDNYGYAPEKFSNRFIDVRKIKNGYILVDGNHRLRVLLDKYGKDHQIVVKVHSILPNREFMGKIKR